MASPRVTFFLATVALIWSLTSAAPSQCSCGRSRGRNYLSGRVVGGTESPSGRFPWMVGFLDPFGFNFCGGVLVSRQHVLTAAHCVHNKRPGDLRAVVGEHDVDLAYLFNRVQRIRDVTVHPHFVHARWSHDIAVVTLRDPVAIHVETICLPHPTSRHFANLVVAGWGKTSTKDPLKPSRLHQVSLPQVDERTCEAAWAENAVSSRDQMCAGSPGRDTCVYDSGSPLMDMSTDQITLAGVTSFGSSQCGEPSKPGVYTRIASYLDFIGTNTRGACYAR